MKLQTEEPVVVIEMPRICVEKDDADNYIMMFNKFWNDICQTIIQDYGGERYEYDTRYCNGEVIPTIKHICSYSDILDKNIDIKQIDEYVEIDEKDGYVSGERVEKCWMCESETEEVEA